MFHYVVYCLLRLIYGGVIPIRDFHEVLTLKKQCLSVVCQMSLICQMSNVIKYTQKEAEGICSIISLLSYDKCLIFKYAWSRMLAIFTFSHTKYNVAFWSYFHKFYFEGKIFSKNYIKLSIILMEIVFFSMKYLLKVSVQMRSKYKVKLLFRWF